MHTIYKYQRTGSGFKERLVIKGFKTSGAMYAFTQTQGNLWAYCQGPNAHHDKFAAMKPGTYAFAGGRWHNVKNLDASVLAHV